jgi:hypothetical protein
MRDSGRERSITVVASRGQMVNLGINWQKGMGKATEEKRMEWMPDPGKKTSFARRRRE